MLKFNILILPVCCILIFTGCTTPAPQKTSLELQAIQSREFETTKKIGFAATLSVFQDLGYIISSAEFNTGFITAKSPTKTQMAIFVGNVMTDTKATGFIEELTPGKTKIRLNFVSSKETSTSYGMKSATDYPIEDPLIYQNAFSKIREGIFIRSGIK